MDYGHIHNIPAKKENLSYGKLNGRRKKRCQLIQ